MINYWTRGEILSSLFSIKKIMDMFILVNRLIDVKRSCKQNCNFYLFDYFLK